MIAPKLPIFGCDVLDELENYQLKTKLFGAVLYKP